MKISYTPPPDVQGFLTSRAHAQLKPQEIISASLRSTMTKSPEEVDEIIFDSITGKYKGRYFEYHRPGEPFIVHGKRGTMKCWTIFIRQSLGSVREKNSQPSDQVFRMHGQSLR